MATTPPQGGAGAPRKKIPTWYYVVGGVGLLGLYYLYSKSKANAAAAAAASTPATGTAPVGTAAGSYGNAGDLAALAPYLQNMQGQPSTSTSGGSGATYTAPPGQYASGSGYAEKGNAPVTGTSGAQYIPIVGPDQLGSYVAGGNTAYVQSLPGVFTPYDPKGKYTSGTQVWALV